LGKILMPHDTLSESLREVTFKNIIFLIKFQIS